MGNQYKRDYNQITLKENKNVSTNNKSGFTGVIFNKESKKWKAYIMCNGVNYHLGFFLDKEKAIQARKKAELKYNFL